MLDTNVTPPDITKAIFPINGNEAFVTSVAISHGIIAYPQSNMLVFEGYLNDYHDLANILTGGVLA